MASLSELKSVRQQKLQLLKDVGMDPYAVHAGRTHTISQTVTEFEMLAVSGEAVTLSGRIMAIRGQGGIFFVPLFDGTGQIQVVFKRDTLAESLFQLFIDAVDIADIVEVTGTVFVTERGEKSLLVTDWNMLTKSLIPLPDKWHGITDDEERYRKRYLDALMNRDVFSRFELRSKIIRYIRDFFDSHEFLEIETPILQNQAGGAMARTFNTHHNDYDIDMVLRISLELEHKMMMVAGYNRIYEIGKNFRNEGSDPTHLQEFTMIEWYAAYESLETNMEWTEQLLRGLARDVVGKTTFTMEDKNRRSVEVNFDQPWGRVRFGDLLLQNASLDMNTAADADIRACAGKWGMSTDEIATTGRGNLLDFIFKKSSRNTIIDPTFVLDYPSELKPLAQQNPDGTARVAQLIIGGAEITNQYAELVNPILQRQLLEQQSAAKSAGDAEAMDIDEQFLTAMEHGMPPMTGFGMGIDRLVAILTEQNNLREVVFFPIMRPKNSVALE